MSVPNYLIICSGSTVKDHVDAIENYANNSEVICVGVNNATELFQVDYHLWTNYQRFKTFYKGECENLILSESLYKKIKENRLFGFDSQSDQVKVETIYDNIKIWRTAGLRAIQYAADKGCENIAVVGMDGYTLLHNGDQHCYGKGYTDIGRAKDPGELIHREFEKDNQVYENLRCMKKKGVNVKILTPTVFNEFYAGGLL